LCLATIEGDSSNKGKFPILDCGVPGRKPCTVPMKNGIAENDVAHVHRGR